MQDQVTTTIPVPAEAALATPGDGPLATAAGYPLHLVLEKVSVSGCSSTMPCPYLVPQVRPWPTGPWPYLVPQVRPWPYLVPQIAAVLV